MNSMRFFTVTILFFSQIYTSEHNHDVYYRTKYTKNDIRDNRIYDSQTQRYVYQYCMYGYNVHDKHNQRLHALLKILEIEQKKLIPDSLEKRRMLLGLPSEFNRYESTKVRQDQPADFRGIFKALHRLQASIICPACKFRIQGVIEENKKKVQNLVQENNKNIKQ